MSKVYIGHAVSNENGKVSGGKAGDQTSSEVLIQEWYVRPGGWTHVLRAKNKADAEKIAKAVEQACKNNHVGYDQKNRTTLFFEAKNNGWNIDKITSDCACDCSSLVAVAVNVAGIEISKDMYTGNELEVLKGTKKFSVFTQKKYLTSSSDLERGDILLGDGHTAVVLGDISSDSEATMCTVTFRQLKKGDKGKDVRILQMILKASDYEALDVDGIFGDITNRVVRDFQRKKGLSVDGIVGNKTWDALVS